MRRVRWYGIPAATATAHGNVEDALGVCGGTAAADADGDGICDDADNCTDLSACNYRRPGQWACAVLTSAVLRRRGIPAGDCDC